MEYVALRANYMNLNSEFDESKEEQQHLNVQLINLINANKALEETATRLTQDNEILRTKNDDLKKRAEATEDKYRDYEQEMMRVKTVSDKQAIELVKYEVEITRMNTAMDATKSEYQKKWLKLSKEKDLELQNVTNQRTNESQQNRAQTQQLEREVETLKGQVRVANRQIENEQQKCKEYQGQIHNLEKEANTLRDSLKVQTEEFRGKLLTYLQRVSENNGDEESEPSSFMIEDLKVTQKKLYDELVATHDHREQDLLKEAEEARKKNRKLYQQLETTTSKVLLLQDFIKDVAPDATLPGDKTLNKHAHVHGSEKRYLLFLSSRKVIGSTKSGLVKVPHRGHVHVCTLFCHQSI